MADGTGTERAAKIRTAAAAERQLIEDEQAVLRRIGRAAEKLESASEKLHRAQRRYDRQRQALTGVEGELAAARERRALGPGVGLQIEEQPAIDSPS